MAAELHEQQRSLRLRQRLWGATVIIAIAVLVLPLLLDGSGSESQFRRVEKLREEPPRILNADGELEPVAIPVRKTTESAGGERGVLAELRSMTDKVWAPDADGEPVINSDGTAAAAISGNRNPDALVAWVVQAGSFVEEANALAVRDRLRRSGYPSFVSQSNERSSILYRVQVGPMIDQSQANLTREKVMSLLGRDAIVVSYP